MIYYRQKWPTSVARKHAAALLRFPSRRVKYFASIGPTVVFSFPDTPLQTHRMVASLDLTRSGYTSNAAYEKRVRHILQCYRYENDRDRQVGRRYFLC